MIKHFCDKCGKEIDADTCEEVIFDEKGPVELCDDCYESFTFMFDAWLTNYYITPVDKEHLKTISNKLNNYINDKLDKEGVCPADEVCEKLHELLGINYVAPVRPSKIGYVKLKM